MSSNLGYQDRYLVNGAKRISWNGLFGFQRDQLESIPKAEKMIEEKLQKDFKRSFTNRYPNANKKTLIDCAPVYKKVVEDLYKKMIETLRDITANLKDLAKADAKITKEEPPTAMTQVSTYYELEHLVNTLCKNYKIDPDQDVRMIWDQIAMNIVGKVSILKEEEGLTEEEAYEMFTTYIPRALDETIKLVTGILSDNTFITKALASEKDLKENGSPKLAVA